MRYESDYKFYGNRENMIRNFRFPFCVPDMLGDRLASSEDSSLKEQAQICYICSGNLNKTVESSNVDIQEVVELVMVMQKALEVQGIRDIQIQGNIANVLSQYAEMLATQGELEAALNYLGNSQDEKIVMMKDRLCRALGYIQESRSVTKAPAMQSYYDQTRRPLQTVQNPLLVARSQAQPFVDSNVAPPTKQPFVPSMNQFNTQPQQPFGLSPLQPHAQPMQYDQYQTSQPFGSPAVSQPPPPPLPTSGSSGIGSRPPSVGPQARSKYLIDPSVKSTPTYGQSGFPQQTSLYSNPQIPPLPGYSSTNAFQAQIPAPTSAYPGQTYAANPIEPEPFKPVQPSILSPLQNPKQGQTYEPIKTQPLPQTQVYGSENVYQAVSQPAGWNDPPAAKTSRAQVNIFIIRIF